MPVQVTEEAGGDWPLCPPLEIPSAPWLTQLRSSEVAVTEAQRTQESAWCVPLCCHHAMAVTAPFGIVPALLITVWAAGPNPLAQAQGQARPKTALVFAEFAIVLPLHMALEP